MVAKLRVNTGTFKKSKSKKGPQLVNIRNYKINEVFQNLLDRRIDIKHILVITENDDHTTSLLSDMVAEDVLWWIEKHKFALMFQSSVIQKNKDGA